MIKSITLRNIATYDGNGILIKDCKPINIIYGDNGTGKTTISNYLKDMSNVCYKDCNVKFEESELPEILVYNKKFKEENFGNDEVPGIFTLGKSSKEQQNKINEKKGLLQKDIGQLDFVHDSIDRLTKEMTNDTTDFIEVVWGQLYKKYEGPFAMAFKGYRDSKQKFFDKAMQEYQALNENSNTYEELKDKADILFNKESTVLNNITNIDESSIKRLIDVEFNEIWGKNIIGKQDIKIASLINYLQNNDWVRQGQNYIRENDVCPFCQQHTITSEFKNELQEYFSGEFERDINLIKDLIQNYEICSARIIKQIGELADKYEIKVNKNVNIPHLIEVQKSLCEQIKHNLEYFKNKLKEPSRIISISSTEESIKKIADIIKNANRFIDDNNALVLNQKEEICNLTSLIWSFILSENKDIFEGYCKKNAGQNNGMKNLKERVGQINQDIASLKMELETLTKGIVSIEPSINEMNNILKCSGFSGFKITKTEKTNFYQIQRDDGTLVKDTLSEGEITFITFIYFFQLIKGNFDTNNIGNNRIVIIDDPISSLDTHILFIISSLIKAIITDIKTGVTNVKQLFVLTHNLYFHQELSFINSRESENGKTFFWILRKMDRKTTIDHYEQHNPIRSSYTLLWDGIKNYDSLTNISLQNNMRRILEYYFTILGGYKYENIIERLETIQEKEICHSLFSWINSGSHGITDDLYSPPSNENNELYFNIFKKIFAFANQISHFNMMLGLKDE